MYVDVAMVWEVDAKKKKKKKKKKNDTGSIMKNYQNIIFVGRKCEIFGRKIFMRKIWAQLSCI